MITPLGLHDRMFMAISLVVNAAAIYQLSGDGMSDASRLIYSTALSLNIAWMVFIATGRFHR